MSNLQDSTAGFGPACLDFITQVQNVQGLNSDYDEWQTLQGNAKAALNTQAPQGFIDVMNEFVTLNLNLWTNGEDQDSWAAVLGGMQQAASATDPHTKFISMLSGFTQVTDPSHNGSVWEGLQELAVKYSSL